VAIRTFAPWEMEICVACQRPPYECTDRRHKRREWVRVVPVTDACPTTGIHKASCGCPKCCADLCKCDKCKDKKSA
jgi:hypothetical protein